MKVNCEGWDWKKTDLQLGRDFGRRAAGMLAGAGPRLYQNPGDNQPFRSCLLPCVLHPKERIPADSPDQSWNFSWRYDHLHLVAWNQPAAPQAFAA